MSTESSVAEMQNDLIEEVATRIKDYRLQMPAIFLLELYKPLSTIFFNLTLLTSPLFAAILGMKKSGQIRELLSTTDGVESLICRLESDLQRGQDGRN